MVECIKSNSMLYAVLLTGLFKKNFNAMEDEVHDTSKNFKNLILYCPYSKRGK